MNRRPPRIRSIAGPTSGATTANGAIVSSEVERDLVARRAGRDREEQRARERDGDQACRSPTENACTRARRVNGVTVNASAVAARRGRQRAPRAGGGHDVNPKAARWAEISPVGPAAQPAFGSADGLSPASDAGSSGPAGRTSVKVDPSPSRDSSLTSPPRLSATWRTMARPRPVPGTSDRPGRPGRSARTHARDRGRGCPRPCPALRCPRDRRPR